MASTSKALSQPACAPKLISAGAGVATIEAEPSSRTADVSTEADWAIGVTEPTGAAKTSGGKSLVSII